MATPTNLPILVRDAFKAAQKAGDLTFYETQVSILQCYGLPFQVRFSPALANKPKNNNKPHGREANLVDPFSDPPKALLIASLRSHNLILNKFPVIPDHFILATKTFKEQTDLLEEDDLSAAYECLRVYRDNEEELFGFFNSGEHSGASQKHRHIQFLPVGSMMVSGQSWEVLANTLTNKPARDLPFLYLSYTLPSDPTPTMLYETYIQLHENACRNVQELASSSSTADAKPPISYNLGFTERTMILCPRVSEGSRIKNDDGEDIGFVSLNGTVLGGTLLVKTADEYSALCDDESKLVSILSAIGVKPTQSVADEKL